MSSFPSHLIYESTLPENTLIQKVMKTFIRHIGRKHRNAVFLQETADGSEKQVAKAMFSSICQVITPLTFLHCLYTF